MAKRINPEVKAEICQRVNLGEKVNDVADSLKIQRGTARAIVKRAEVALGSQTPRNIPNGEQPNVQDRAKRLEKKDPELFEYIVDKVNRNSGYTYEKV